MVVWLLPANAAADKKCLLVMSYHTGYAWNDGIELEVERVLTGHCVLKKFFMDTKRNTSVAYAKNKAQQVKQLIAQFKPDVVIATDDNAAKYVVTQYKNADLPFVFAGINWTAAAYGFPYKNVTGMVEVGPIIPLLKIIKKTVKNVRSGVYISADVITERKDYVRYRKVYQARGVRLTAKFVKNMHDWEVAYNHAQKADFIIVNNYAGINDWDTERAIKIVTEKSKKFTVSYYKFMMPYVMFSITKSAKEQGRWAAEVALAVLSGTAVSDIPITINKEWHMFANVKLLQKAKISLDTNTKRRTSTKWESRAESR
ncbi:hypothetical protein MNBD_GAMMA23-623 [hydrothermal vent metagenome]|uniref:ABC transporter substrate-binding protein n=1 Tax=hydrothermal vent metagenome TaxID=652676 RepID=A0A3B1AY79_9ZZZZ